MAGIGFELRKMFSESDSTFGDLKAIAYSTIISVGPWIITAVSLNILLYIAKGYILLRSERVIFMSTVLYAFIFSQLLVSPWQYMVTRYVSDCIYKGRTEELRGAFIGIMKLTIILSFIVGRLFFHGSPLPPVYKGISTTLFTLLSASWICMSFVSVVKNYSFVAYSYIGGNIVAIVLGILLGKIPVEFTENILSTNLLLAYTLGILLTFLMLSYHLLTSFTGKDGSEFAFLRYLRGYRSLFFIGLFYTMGVWGHLFVTWIKGDYYIISGTFRTSPLYEVALFYAFLITIPSLVYFVVFLETKFFPDYKKYYAYLSYKGTAKEIERSKKNMMAVLRRELYYCMELQFFISLSVALTANIVFNYYEMDLYLLELFRIFIFGAYCVIFVSIMITILLYLDAKEEALLISFVFMVSNIVFTYILTSYGEEYTGLGFFLASFMSLILGKNLLQRTFDELTYISFYRQNFIKRVGSPLLTKIEVFFNRKGYIPVLIILLLAGFFSGCTSYDKRGFNSVSGRNWHTMSLYDVKGYDVKGYNQEGADIMGFDSEGYHIYSGERYDFYGFDVHGVNRDTGGPLDERGFDWKGVYLKDGSKYDPYGYDREGIHRETGTVYSPEGWTYYGLNEKTQDYYDEKGYNIEGYDRQGYDPEGYDSRGNDVRGWNRAGINEYTGMKYDSRGFDTEGYNSLTDSELDERGFDLDGKYLGREIYDEKGYDLDGVHRDTGTDYSPEGWTYYGLNEKTQDYYDEKGYNLEGYDEEGYNRSGYDQEGYNKKGYNISGYDREGYSQKGWNRRGVYKYTGTRYDFYGFDIRGIHRDTRSQYDTYGWSNRGIHRETGTRYDSEGYDRNGYSMSGGKRIDTGGGSGEDTRGFDGRGINIKTGTRYDREGYDVDGLDRDGFNREGIYIED